MYDGNSSSGDIDDELDLDADIPTLEPGALRDELRRSRGRVRSLTAELAGQSHALNALRTQVDELSEADPSTKQGWISQVARAAQDRAKAAPGRRKRSPVLNLSGRARDLVSDVTELNQRLEEVEEEARYLRESAAHTEAWLDQLRREGRVPHYPPGEIERLHHDLDSQAERIEYLEDELQKKADVIGDMLQKVERAEDARTEAVARYKGLLKQQERIAAAFQEQTRRVRTLQTENDELRAKGDGATNPVPSSPQEAGASDEALEALRASIQQANSETRAARELLRTTQAQLDAANRAAREADIERARLQAENKQIAEQVSQARRASFDRQSDTEDSRTRLGVAEARVLELELSLQELNREHALLKEFKRAAQAREQGAQEALDALKAELERGGEALGLAQSQRERLQERLTAAEALTTRLGGELAEHRERSNDLTSQLSAALSVQESLQSKLEEQSVRESALCSQLEDANAARDAADKAKAEALSSAAQANRELNEGAARLSEVQQALEQSEDERSRALRGQIRAEARQREAEEASDKAAAALAASQASQHEAEHRAADLDAQIEHLESQSIALRAEVKRQQAGLEEAEARAREATSRLEGLDAARASAEARAQNAEERAREAELVAAHSSDLAKRAQASAEEADARLRGAEAHRKNLEDRLAEEAGARTELQTLKPRLEAAEGARRALEARVEQEVALRAELNSEHQALKTRIEDHLSSVGTLEEDLQETRNRSMSLREDLRKARQAISELSDERDAARDTAARLERSAGSIEADRAQWADERAQLQSRLDRAQDELTRLRERRDHGPSDGFAAAAASRASWAAGPATTPEAPPRFEADEPHVPSSLSDLAPRPSAGDLPPEIDDAARAQLSRATPADPPPSQGPRWGRARPQREEPVSIDDWQPMQAPIPDEPYAPVDLEARDERGIADPQSPTTRRLSTRTNRPQSSRQTSTASRQGASAQVSAARPADDAWQALVAGRKFRSRDASTPEPASAPLSSRRGAAQRPATPVTEPTQRQEPPARWDRPIVDLELDSRDAGIHASSPVAGGSPAQGSPQSSSPTVEEVQSLLSSGDVRQAHGKARSLWRRQPSDGARLGLFLKASRSNGADMMEALAELDERLDPRKVSVEEAATVSACLIENNLPSEAVPYVLWPLSEAEAPAEHPLLAEGTRALELLRSRSQGTNRSASLMTTLNTLPLSSLGPLFFHSEGFTLRALRGTGRNDFEMSNASNLPGLSLGPGEGARVRALMAAGAYIDPGVLDDFEGLYPESTGVKQRVSFAIVPQAVDSQVFRELKRIRKKNRHLIIPLHRAQLVDALLDGTGQAILKAAIKGVK